MSEYTVKETYDMLRESETGKWYEVIDPLGNVIEISQYQYMANRTANDLNAGTKGIRAEIARLKAELAKEEEKGKQLIEAIRHAKHDIGDGNFSRAHSILDLALWVKPDQDLLVESEGE